ncbi:MAG: iron-containing alcohol dehydrogenase, partial [Muribaculaceae bacterium]|nr:iron-containing alcohol dehydrogenase [Muribaculaceae bacterium]
MENFEFQTPTQYVFGRGTESQTGALTRGMGASRVLLVYGGGSARRSGLLDRVEKSLADAGVDFVGL